MNSVGLPSPLRGTPFVLASGSAEWEGATACGGRHGEGPEVDLQKRSKCRHRTKSSPGSRNRNATW